MDVPDEETLEFERLMVLHVTADFTRTLDDLIKAILEVYATFKARGPLTPEQKRGIYAGIVMNIQAMKWSSMAPALLSAATYARDLGQARAIRKFTDPQAKLADWRSHGMPEIPNIDQMARDGLSEAMRISDPRAVAGKLRATRARVQGTTRYVANEGINAGTAEVARTMGLRLLWVSERNACLHCLAYAGYAVEVGDDFPPRLSFDPKGSTFHAVPHPPLHPNCRCQVDTYAGEPGPPSTDRSSLSPADRLAAEARRSVVYQWTDHASGPAARRAAESLLKAGAALPSSVEKRALAGLRRRKT